MSKSWCDACRTWTKPDGYYSECPVCELRTSPPVRYALRNDNGRLLSTDGGVTEVMTFSEATSWETREELNQALGEYPWCDIGEWVEVIEIVYPSYKEVTE